MTGRRILGLLVAVAAATPAPAATPPLLAVGPLAPFHLRPEGLELGEPPAPGGWRLALTLGYGNTWATTHHIPDLHVALDPPGAPLGRDTVLAALARWPEDTFYTLDAEVRRAELEVAWSPRRRWAVGAGLGWLLWGGTPLDPLPDRLHRLLGVTRGSRPYFPAGRTVILVKRGRRVFYLDQPPRDGPGRARAWVYRELGTRNGWRQWVGVEVAAPTARVTALGGDAWEWGVRWRTHGRAGPLEVDAGLGWSDLAGDAPTLDRVTDAWHLWWSGTLPLSRGLALAAGLRLDTSPYWHRAPGQLHKASLELAVGPAIRLDDALELVAALGENVPAIGLAPDFSIQVRLAWSEPPGGPAR